MWANTNIETISDKELKEKTTYLMRLLGVRSSQYQQAIEALYKEEKRANELKDLMFQLHVDLEKIAVESERRIKAN